MLFVRVAKSSSLNPNRWHILFTLSLLPFVIDLRVQLLQKSDKWLLPGICGNYLRAFVKTGETVAGKDVIWWMAEQLQSERQNGDLKQKNERNIGECVRKSDKLIIYFIWKRIRYWPLCLAAGLPKHFHTNTDFFSLEHGASQEMSEIKCIGPFLLTALSQHLKET